MQKTINLTPLNTGSPVEHPVSTLTITHRPWTAEEHQRLANILFGPHPDQDS
ncbi:hypothetical protein PV336_15765 [Streptomyces sp. MI02-2A]|uniref:hypothetical protein n=1 Tax=Streptomyces sp. MI02-2A TaxID=3028688 RepID=UPI0029BCA31A|nr:hypothetical protein [Streptomyces sp. MI02-2A]MDX3260676.1 hypothetical protein [Streptomyces sp. MI02-2A]